MLNNNNTGCSENKYGAKATSRVSAMDIFSNLLSNISFKIGMFFLFSSFFAFFPQSINSTISQIGENPDEKNCFELLSKIYQNLSLDDVLIADLNNDDSNEYLVIISYNLNNGINYCVHLYVYEDNAQPEIFFIDSAFSGLRRPEVVFLEELDINSLLVGNQEFDSLCYELGFSIPDIQKSTFSIFAFNGVQIACINDRVIDFFMDDAKILLNVLAGLSTQEELDCTFTQKYGSLILSSVYNFYSAGEISMAKRVFDRFFKCDRSPQLNRDKGEVYKVLTSIGCY